MGHFVRCGTKHENAKWETVDGLEIFEGTDVFIINQMVEEENFDIIFSFWDVWILAGHRLFPKDKWVCYAPINTDPISPVYKDILEETAIQIAMTRDGEAKLRQAGFNPLYAPHGIHTSIFRPDEEARVAVRQDLGWGDEHFVIGSVGLNYGDDVKGYLQLMMAFKGFHDIHPEARLFLCTLANDRGAVKSSINYVYAAETIGIDSSLIGWPHQGRYFLNRLTDDELRGIYNAMDVFVLPTKGETFSLTIVESQACGVPIITSGIASGPELCKTGWLIDVDKFDDREWLPTGTFRYIIKPSKIIKCLELAYNAWKYGDYGKLRGLARERILEYDWENIWDIYFSPIFKLLEDRFSNKK
jgi:glycosyltransferase involved in cell wall biosynthesis